MTYNQDMGLPQKELHLGRAEGDLEAALREANMVRPYKPHLVVYVQYEQACLQARKLELTIKRGLDKKEIATRASATIRKIQDTMGQLRELSPEIWRKLNIESREYWLQRLEKMRTGR